MREVGIRRHRLPSAADRLVCGDDHRHLRGQAHAFAHRRCRGKIVNLGVESSQRGHGRAQHVHRMRIANGANDVDHSRGQRARSPEAGLESIELCPRRQLAMEQQVARFLERRAGGEIVDRIAAVEKLAGAPVDEAHARAVEIHALQSAMNLDLA